MQAQASQQDSYELFRRAIVERDEQAWIDSAARYRPLLAAWASRCSASAALTESYDDLADQAFARAWSALSPERFANFPTLAALLAIAVQWLAMPLNPNRSSSRKHGGPAEGTTKAGSRTSM